MRKQARTTLGLPTPADALKPARGIVRGLGISAVLWALALAAVAFWI
jgi:hypothetical protein